MYMYFVAVILQIILVLNAFHQPCYAKPISNNACRGATSGQGRWWINPNNYTTNANETAIVDDDGTPIDQQKSINPILRQTEECLAQAQKSVSTYIIFSNSIQVESWLWFIH